MDGTDQEQDKQVSDGSHFPGQEIRPDRGKVCLLPERLVEYIRLSGEIGIA